MANITRLQKHIAKFGGAAVILLFVVLFIKFLVQHHTPAQSGHVILNVVIVTLTVPIIAILYGLLLTVAVALAFITSKTPGVL